VRSLTLDQVKALDAGSYAGPQFAGEPIPTYAETLALVKGTGVRLLLTSRTPRWSRTSCASRRSTTW
jgi:glycerophosphoryl diester phosphodiesterase